MTKRNIPYTLNEITEKLSTRGITLIGPYGGYTTRTEFRCVHGHQWEASTKKVINGSGCLTCSKRPKLTSQDINDRLSKFNITLLSEYRSMTGTIEVTCDSGHIWSDIAKNIKGACRKCTDDSRLKSLRDRKINLLDDVSKLILRDKYNFSCDNGHVWNARLDHLLNGVGCPSCAGYGFNQNKSAWLYILKFSGYGKYGITNNLSRRISELCKFEKAEILYVRHYNKGTDALNTENQIKKTFGGRYVSEKSCPDGWTETVHTDNLNHIINSIK